MLEYCPKGNLRSYLIDHEKEFKISLKNYHDKGSIFEPKNFEDTIVHDIKLLCFWACQVRNFSVTSIAHSVILLRFIGKIC